MDWFRMYHEFASDPKVQSMTEAMQRRLVMLLCLRCSNTLVTLQDDEIAFSMRIDDAALADTKLLFLRKGFINEAWEIVQWDKRQFVSDSSAARVARHREKKREEEKRSGNVTVTPQIQNRTETEAEAEKEKTSTTPVGELLHDVDPQVAQDWADMRKTQKAKINKTAIEGFRKQAALAGLSLEAVLRMCCERGWRGFEASWLKTPPARASPPATHSRHSGFEKTNYHEGVSDGKIN